MKGMEPWVVILLSVFTSGTAVSLLALIKRIIDIREQRRIDAASTEGTQHSTGQFASFLDGERGLQMTMNKLMSAVGANQVLVLRAQNGGKVPVPGSILKSSVCNEVFSNDTESVIESWQNVAISESYVMMLWEVATKGQVRLIVEDMQPGALKDVYLEKGIYKSRVVALLEEPGVFFYMSITWKRKPTKPKSTINNQVRIATRAIKEYLSQRPDRHKGP